MAKSSLNQVIKSLKDTGKSKIGYATKQYDQVLKALQQSKYKIEQATGGSIMGKYSSYGDVEGLQFTSDGFSQDRQVAIWRMKLNRWGAMPVKIVDSGHVMIGVTQKQFSVGPKQYECPHVLQVQGTDSVNGLPDYFLVGAKIDATDMAVSYFNYMFMKRGQDDEQISVNEMSELINSGILEAQLIFPKANISLNVDIVGSTQISNHSVIYLNNCILGSNGWEKTGLKVQAKVGDEVVQLAPNGGNYKYILQGKTYNFKNNSIDDFGRVQYQKEWVGLDGTGKVPAVEILEAEEVDVYVRLFISMENQSKAGSIIKKTFSQNVFKTYGEMIVNTSTASPVTTGGTAQVQLMQGINKFKNCIHWGVNRRPKKRSKEQLRYVYGGGHATFIFQGQNGPAKLESAGANSALVTPLFVPEGMNGDLDCSAFALMVWGSSGIFQQTAKIPCPTTAIMWNMNPNSYAAYLKPQYTLQIHNITPTTTFLPGDWVVSGPGKHVAVVYDANAKLTIESMNSDVQNRSVVGKITSKYKKIIRVVDKK